MCSTTSSISSSPSQTIAGRFGIVTPARPAFTDVAVVVRKLSSSWQPLQGFYALRGRPHDNACSIEELCQMGFRCRLALTGSWNPCVRCRYHHGCQPTSCMSQVQSCLGHALQISFSRCSDLNAYWISSCSILSNTHSSNLQVKVVKVSRCLQTLCSPAACQSEAGSKSNR